MHSSNGATSVAQHTYYTPSIPLSTFRNSLFTSCSTKKYGSASELQNRPPAGMFGTVHTIEETDNALQKDHYAEKTSSPPILLYSQGVPFAIPHPPSRLSNLSLPSRQHKPFHWGWAKDFIKTVGGELRSLKTSQVSVRIWGDLSRGSDAQLNCNSETVDLGVIVTSSDPMTPSCLNRIFNVGRVARVLLVFTTRSNGLTLQHGYHPTFKRRSYCCSGNQVGWAGEVLGRVVGCLGGEDWGAACVESTMLNWGDKSGIAGGLFVGVGVGDGPGSGVARVPPPPPLPQQIPPMRSPREQGGKSPKRRATMETTADFERSTSPTSNIKALSLESAPTTAFSSSSYSST